MLPLRRGRRIHLALHFCVPGARWNFVARHIAAHFRNLARTCTSPLFSNKKHGYHIHHLFCYFRPQLVLCCFDWFIRLRSFGQANIKQCPPHWNRRRSQRPAKPASSVCEKRNGGSAPRHAGLDFPIPRFRFVFSLYLCVPELASLVFDQIQGP